MYGSGDQGYAGSIFRYANAYRMLGTNICTRGMYGSGDQGYVGSLFWYVNAYRMLDTNAPDRDVFNR